MYGLVLRARGESCVEDGDAAGATEGACRRGWCWRPPMVAVGARADVVAAAKGSPARRRGRGRGERRHHAQVPQREEVEKVLEGSVAVVTGGSRGIGRAVCLALAGAGARVVVGYHSRADAAEAVCAAIAAAGGAAYAHQADVAERQQADALIATAQERFGRVDVLVNNAGLTRDGLLLRMSDEAWRQVLSANLDGAFWCLRAASKLMLRQRSGRIINIASVAGTVGNAGQANYSAAKAGLIGLTRTAAAELASRGITVNAVAPGWIDTDMTAGLPEAARQAALARVPLGRMGRAEDIAQAVLYLAGPGASYVTGTVLVVDGGLTMGA